MQRLIINSLVVCVLTLAVVSSGAAQVALSNGVQVGSSAPGLFDVTSQFAPGEVQSTGHVEINTPSSTTVTVEDITGSGTILNFQMDLSGTTSSNDTVLNFYIDGSSTPSITFDVGILGTGWWSTGSAADAGVIVGSGGGGINFLLKYPQYYSTEWKVTLTTPSSGAVEWYDEVRYTSAFTSPLRLKSTNVTFANAAGTNLATTPLVLLNLPSGSGTIAAVFIGETGATNWSYLEAGFYAYLDGSGTAQYQTLGGEDFPGSGWYFNGPLASISSPWFFEHTTTVADSVDYNVDLLALHGGIRFNSGVLFQLQAVPAKSVAITTSVKVAYLCLYYQ